MPSLISEIRGEGQGGFSLEALVFAAGQIGDERAAEPIAALLVHEDRWIRETAAEALTRIEVRWKTAQTLVPLLIQPLTRSTTSGNSFESRVMSVAVYLLGEIGDPSAAATLHKVVQDYLKPGDVRQAAAEALTKIER